MDLRYFKRLTENQRKQNGHSRSISVIEAVNIVAYGGPAPDGVSEARWNAITSHIKREFLSVSEN